MAKHRKWYSKPKQEPKQSEISPPEPTETFSEPKQEIPLSKNTKDMKSQILSATKYAYIIAIAAFFSGIFTPLTLGVEIEAVILGMLSIFLGLAGGIVIFLGIKNQKFTTIMVCAGLGMMVASLFIIYELINMTLFG